MGSGGPKKSERPANVRSGRNIENTSCARRFPLLLTHNKEKFMAEKTLPPTIQRVTLEELAEDAYVRAIQADQQGSFDQAVVIVMRALYKVWKHPKLISEVFAKDEGRDVED